MSPFQIPKKDHPWRTWVGSPKKDKGLGRKRKPSPETLVRKEREKELRSVKSFLSELIKGWEKIEVYTFAYGRSGKYHLKELTQYKVAAWLAGVLKRNYGQQNET